MADGIWYCHGMNMTICAIYPPQANVVMESSTAKKVDSSNLKMNFITERYIMLVYLVQSRLNQSSTKVKKEHEECKGIVFGHTHLPLFQRSPELLFCLTTET